MHHHIQTRRPHAATLASIALVACAGSYQTHASARCVAPLWTAVADIVPAPYAVRVAPGIDPHTLLAWRSPPRKGCRVSAEVEHDWPAAETPWAARLRTAASSAGLAVIVGPATERVQIFPGLARLHATRGVHRARAAEKGKAAPISPQSLMMPIAQPVPLQSIPAMHVTASAVAASHDKAASGPRGPWQVWQIATGERMRAALVTWAKRANWTVEWYASDWRAPVAVEITAKSFLAAAHVWTQSAVSNGAPIRVEARTGNRVLIVESTVRNQNGF
jgi:hypothetical protein